jgi:NAD(P)H-dependent FMN reductase
MKWKLPMFDEPVPPSRLERKYGSEIVQRWSAKISQADGFIIVTPEYNHGYPAVLKNAIDTLYPEWNNKPVAFVGYSSGFSGGIRAVNSLGRW